ncbi:Fungal specific transcription factor domain [Ceratobasidium sp. AG-Ba]|nr:Fungal specific transcription factor domain [Ceratobasidium sp. AG-Ba]
MIQRPRNPRVSHNSYVAVESLPLFGRTNQHVDVSTITTLRNSSCPKPNPPEGISTTAKPQVPNSLINGSNTTLSAPNVSHFDDLGIFTAASYLSNPDPGSSFNIHPECYDPDSLPTQDIALASYSGAISTYDALRSPEVFVRNSELAPAGTSDVKRKSLGLMAGLERESVTYLGHGSHIPSGLQELMPFSEPKDVPISAECDEEDSEGLMGSIIPTLALDRNARSNSLPFILSSYLRWMTRRLFEPMAKAHMVKDLLSFRCTISNTLRDTAMLIANYMDTLGRKSELALSASSVTAQLEGFVCRQLAWAKSSLKSPPEAFQDDALMVLAHVYEITMTLSLSSSIAFQTKLLDQTVPVYRIVHFETLETLAAFRFRFLHPHSGHPHTPETDILLSLITCRPMVFQYDTAIYSQRYNASQVGLQWRIGLPDEFLVMLCQMNKLLQERALSIDSTLTGYLEARINNFEPKLDRTPDSCLYVTRLMVQECWRHFMYIYLYMGLCGANSHDVRVEKALKQLIKLLNKIKPGRIPDIFLVTPISLAGMAAHDEGDREAIRWRIRGIYEYSQPDTYVRNAADIIEVVWATADRENRPAIWRDLRYACRVITGIV